MISALIMIAGGILAASGLIVARKPNAQQLIDKLTPYQGWIGLVMFVWGIRDAIGVLTHIGLIAGAFRFWLLWTLASATELVVGFLLSFGLLTKYVLGKSPTGQQRSQQIRLKLSGYQGLFGIIAIVLGVLYIVL